MSSSLPPSLRLFAPLALCLPILSSCTPAAPQARAQRVSTRSELIGGPRALGEVGDYLLSNDQVRLIIQDKGFSRGFGVFGGSLIDADLVRPESGRGNSVGGVGKDNFGEMFPSFFLQALEPNDVRDPNGSGDLLPAIAIENDGSNGEPAVVVVRGFGNDFLALTQLINETLLGDPREQPNLMFETRYILRPGARYVEIDTKVQNFSPQRPVRFAQTANFGGAQIPIPFGDVVLFGAGNKVFLPHEAGFDLRFRLEEVYASGRYTLPVLPGLVSEFIASTGPDVSYGILVADPENPEQNFAFKNRDQFPEATPHSLHVPFIASAFTGVFQVLPPDELAINDAQPGGADEFHFKRYFIIGDGDVSSISDVAYELLGSTTGEVSGRVLETQTSQAPETARVIIFDEAGTTKLTQASIDETGRFNAKLRPGNYQARVVIPDRITPPATAFSVSEGKTTFTDLRVDAPAEVTVTVVEPGVGPVPAKVTIVGEAPEQFNNQDTKTWLFDLSLGEHWHYSDLEPDTDIPATRRYIEAFDYTQDGAASLTARPGTYTIFASRGPEYTRDEQTVTLVAGQTNNITLTVEKAIDTSGYVSADFHLHSIFSLDSFAGLEERITSYAGEQLEFVVSTDHNFIVDYQPTIGMLGLDRFINSAVGLELTTIDRGHFNGFPLRRGDGNLVKPVADGNAFIENAIASRTYGSFQWAQQTPSEIFSDLRNLGIFVDPTCKDQPGALCARQPVVVQVNHPRDSILGYFDQYGVNPRTLAAEGQSGIFAPNAEQHPEFSGEAFSWDFDAMEVFNGKRYEFLHTFRVPAGVTVDPVSCCPLTPGDIFVEYSGFDCDPEVRDCTCTPEDTAAQVAANKCNPERADISFPGVIEDWFLMLSSGVPVVGTANSDSHEADSEEPGYPRTYLAVDSDIPGNVNPQEIVASLKSGNVLMTNGPFVSVKARGQNNAVATMGQTIIPNSDGTLQLDVDIQTAPWVGVDRIVVFVGGEQVAAQTIPPNRANPFSVSIPLSVAQNRDNFIVVEVSGQESMFPTLYPNEIPPLQFTDVIGALGDSFGFGSNPNAIKPSLTFQTTPFALTNPIFVDGNGDGELTPIRSIPTSQAQTSKSAKNKQVAPTNPATGKTGAAADSAVNPNAPHLPVGSVQNPSEAEKMRQRWLATPPRQREMLSRLPYWMWPSDDPRDIRRVLLQFVRHNHH